MIDIDLGDLESRAEAACLGLFDISELMPDGWAVVGGQTVFLHGCERGRATGGTFPL